MSKVMFMYKCSQCNTDCKTDEFSCYECDTCIDCGGCNCEGEYDESADYGDNDYGQNGFVPRKY